MATLPETPLDLLAAIKRVVDRNPLATNPRDNTEACVYQQTANDGTVRRCLMGEVFVTEYGQTYDQEWEGNGADNVLRFFLDEDIDDDVLHLADRAQCYADGAAVTYRSTGEIVPYDMNRPWGIAYDILERKLNGE